MKRLFNGLGKKGRAMMWFCLIGGGYMATEHKKLCKSVSSEVREIHRGIKHNFEKIKK
jgi:hypothetical protein